jgi:membrane protease YdiL (CAAX protease family)
VSEYLPPAPAAPRIRGVWRRIILAMVIFVALTTLLSAAYLASTGILATAANTTPSDPALQAELKRVMESPKFLVFMMLGQAVMGIITVLLMTAGVDRRRIGSLGLGGPGGIRGGSAAWGLMLGTILAAVSILFISAVGGRHLKPALFEGLGWSMAAATLLATLAAAFMEEWFVRGYVFVNLREGYPAERAIFLTAIVFSFLHSSNPGSNFLGWVNILLIGIVLGQLREISGGLEVPIGLHAGWNLVVGMLFGAQVSGFSLPSVLRVSIRDLPAVLGGGDFGPEGSLVVTVLFGAIAVLLGRRMAGAARGNNDF